MLTKRQRNQIPIGIERFDYKERPMQTLQEAERQVVEAAMALFVALNTDGGLATRELMELDYACVALQSAQDRANEVPPLPPYVEGWGADEIL